MGNLTVVSAGAGTGKTYDVCEEISKRVSAKLDPARILATTFTTKAAAELKGRIQAKLLSDPRLSAEERRTKAERLELAAIGTVHSVGYQLLSKYALRLGLSPKLEVLEEAGAERHLRSTLHALGQEGWKKIEDVAARLEMESVQDLALRLLAMKRMNAITDDDFGRQMLESGGRLIEILSPSGPSMKAPAPGDLYPKISKIIEAIAKLGDQTQVTQTALERLSALENRRRGSWGDLVRVQGIKAGKKSGADRSLDPLREFASRVRDSSTLHNDIQLFLKELAALTLALGKAYLNYKTERGLVDFVDLEVHFLELLRNKAVREDFSHDFELVVVDEFQDTNPIQLAIFQELRKLAKNSRWVGDPKQAIYGFRDTDARLLGKIWDATPEKDRERLPDNYRSQEGLVLVANELFGAVFGAEARVGGKRPPVHRAVERWLLETKNKTQDGTALARGIRELLSEGTRPSEIAILVRTNREATATAAALEAAGIPAVVELPGLLETREGALVLSGLRVVADREDALAAATILHLLENPGKETPDWIGERLQDLRNRKKDERMVPWEGHPLLSALSSVDARSLPPSVIVERVAALLGVGSLLRIWGDASRRSFHLDALTDAARSYEDEALEAGQAATLTGLITHFETQLREEKDIRPASSDLEAVTVLTYHKSKGLEWPVVLLLGLDFDREPELWKPGGIGGGDEGDPLKGRAIRFWPWPFGMSDGPYPEHNAGSGLEDDVLQTEEGKAETQERAREAQRLLYVGFTRARDRAILVHRPGKSAWLDLIPGVDRLLDPSLSAGEHPLDACKTTFVIRRLNPLEVDEVTPIPEKETWLVPAGRPESPASAVPRFASPSSQLPLATPPKVILEKLPGAHPFPKRIRDADTAAFGDAVHSYLGALPSLKGLSPEAKETVALRCLDGFGVVGHVTPESLVKAGDRLEAWVASRYPDAFWHAEIAATTSRKLGGQWNGTLDLALECASGWAVIDHKSAPIPEELCAKKALEFTGQLAAYQELLAAQGFDVRELWIHFPIAGVMARLTNSE